MSKFFFTNLDFLKVCGRTLVVTFDFNMCLNPCINQPVFVFSIFTNQPAPTILVHYIYTYFFYRRPIRNVWEVMKAQTETSGLAHLKSAHQLSAELTKITEIGEQGRDKRRLKEETVR